MATKTTTYEDRLASLDAERDALARALADLDQQRSDFSDHLQKAQAEAERTGTKDALEAALEAEQHDHELQLQRARKQAALAAVQREIEDTGAQQQHAERQAKLDRVKAIRAEACRLADKLDKSLHDGKQAHQIMVQLDDLHQEAIPLWRELYGDSVELQGHEFYSETWALPAKALAFRVETVLRVALGKPDPKEFDPFRPPHYYTMREALRLD